MNERVLALMDLMHLSKTEFSKKTGISLSVISHISSGRNKVSIDQIVKILEIFPEVSSEWLLSGKGSWKKMDETQKIKADLTLQLTILEHEIVRIQGEISLLAERISTLKTNLY